jgi:hypothetical protein
MAQSHHKLNIARAVLSFAAFPCCCDRREYNRRVREVVEQSWIEQDA